MKSTENVDITTFSFFQNQKTMYYLRRIESQKDSQKQDY